MRHGKVAAALIAAGEVLILAHHRPISDYYFPFVWIGFALLLDAAVEAQTGASLFANHRALWLVMLPMSAAFWWLFELFNTAVNNWVYIGGSMYTGLAFVALASLDFSTVLVAVWAAAAFVAALLPRSCPRGRGCEPVPRVVLLMMAAAGIATIILPILWPDTFFGLIWGCMFLLLDPINEWLGRPSMIGAAWRGNWALPVSFALGALLCGFFWEMWNYWSMPKWIYHIPHVAFVHVFEMPILGYSGYLPFGLELFAMTNFILPLLGLGTLTLGTVPRPAADRQKTADIAS